MNSHPAPAHQQAIACFVQLRSIGVSFAIARAIARNYEPPAPRPTVLPVRRSLVFGVVVSISIRDGAARGIHGGN